MGEEIPARLSPYVRRPPRVRLPGSPAPERLRSRLVRFFVVRFLMALPDDLADAVGALLDPFERVARLAGRVCHGPTLRGDPARESYVATCARRAVPRLRRRARVDLAFADGSWPALRTDTHADGAGLRAALALS